MNKTIERIQRIFVGIFVVLCLGVAALQYFYLAPMRRCEASGNWWAPRLMRCAVPVEIEKLTGRPDKPFQPADPAAAAKADAKAQAQAQVQAQAQAQP